MWFLLTSQISSLTAVSFLYIYHTVSHSIPLSSVLLVSKTLTLKQSSHPSYSCRMLLNEEIQPLGFKIFNSTEFSAALPDRHYPSQCAPACGLLQLRCTAALAKVNPFICILKPVPFCFLRDLTPLITALILLPSYWFF